MLFAFVIDMMFQYVMRKWKCGMSFFQMLKSLMVKEQCMYIYIILKSLASYCLFFVSIMISALRSLSSAYCLVC